MVGPASISMGRGDYNEAITRTDDEQMLMSIVRSRYGETYNMLAVTGVAANVRFGVAAGVQAAWGRREAYSGRVTPFSAGLAYEENPTITYAPAQGAEYLRQLLWPIPLDILVLSVRTTTEPSSLFTLMVNRVNNIRNPDFLPPQQKPDPRFARFLELSRGLSEADVIHWVKGVRKEVDFSMVITGYAPMYSEKVRELLTLLELPMPEDESKDIVLPLLFALRGKELGGIAITTRSTADLVQILSASVEVPEEHAQSGLAISYPPVGLAGQDVRIRLSRGRPNNGWVAVKYRGFWFYIDEIDQRTKLVFRVTSIIWNVSIATAARQQPAPVLTVPVSR
jgi:hypothetical protein